MLTTGTGNRGPSGQHFRIGELGEEEHSKLHAKCEDRNGSGEIRKTKQRKMRIVTNYSSKFVNPASNKEGFTRTESRTQRPENQREKKN